MAKKPCPNCRKLFDYEFNSWVCPKCGTVITASMEDQTFDTGEFQAASQKKYKSVPTVRDYDKKHGTGVYRVRKIAIRIVAAAITLSIISVFALIVISDKKDASVHVAEPEPTVSSVEIVTEEYTDSTEYTEPEATAETSTEAVITEIETASAAVGDPIEMGGYTLTIMEIFEPQWQELPKAEGWRYIAVSFEKNDADGNEMYGFCGKDAYASLHDKTEGVHLMALYESDIISYEDEDTSLYMSYDMISGLSYGSGTLLFLVKDTSEEFELCISEGEGTSYSDYELYTERRIEIPVTVTEQEVSAQP